MSMINVPLGDEKIPLQKVILPTIDINKQKQYDFLAGVSSKVFKNITANSASNSNISFSYKPSSSVIISRAMYIRYKLTFTVTGTTGGSQLIQYGLDDAVRQFCLQQNCSSITLKLNGSNLELNQPNQILPCLLRYTNTDDQNLDFSSCGSMVDQYQQYEDYNTLGFQRNPLGRIGLNPTQQPRGALKVDFVSNTNVSSVFSVEITEPLLIPSLLFRHHQTLAGGFANVQDLQLNFNISSLQHALSHANSPSAGVLTSVTVQLNNSGNDLPRLLFQELTPDMTLASSVIQPQKVYNYPFKNMSVYAYDGVFGSVLSGATASGNINSIQTGYIPSAIYLAVQERFSDKTAGDRNWRSTDTFAGIEQVGFSVNGTASIMSEALQSQIYQTCQENGLRDSFTQFQQYVGSPILLQVGKDIPLQAGQAAGQVQNFNFQFTNLTIRNLSNATKNYEVIVVFVYDSILSISSAQAVQSSGLLDTQKVVMAPFVSSKMINPVYGGSFFGSLFDGIKDVVNTVSPIVGPLVKPVANITKTLLPETAPILGAIGLGRKKGMKSRLRGKGLTGDHYMYGGAINDTRKVGYMDREELQKRLENEDEEQEE